MRAENYLVLLLGSKVTWFLAWGSIDFVFVRVVQIDLVLYAGQKSVDSRVSVELDFVFVWVVEIDLL